MTDTTDPQADRAAILAEAIARVEDPEERAKTATGLGLGWEAARDVLRRMADEAQQPETEDGRCPALFDQFSSHHEMRRLDPDSPERCAYCGKTDEPAAVSQPGKEA